MNFSVLRSTRSSAEKEATAEPQALLPQTPPMTPFSVSPARSRRVSSGQPMLDVRCVSQFQFHDRNTILLPEERGCLIGMKAGEVIEIIAMGTEHLIVPPSSSVTRISAFWGESFFVLYTEGLLR